MEKRVISDQAMCDMHKLMADKTVEKKVELAAGDGKTYSRYDIKNDGSVILGETRFRFWNRLLNCERILSFESWALAVWDALVDLSVDGNATALEEGLSVEIAKEAQRGGNYEGVVERLMDCYMHVCNNKGGAVSAGTRDKNGSSTTGHAVVNGDNRLVVNVNAGDVNRKLFIPDATGRAGLNIKIGVTGVETKIL
jgi:hypothetical protein